MRPALLVLAAGCVASGPQGWEAPSAARVLAVQPSLEATVDQQASDLGARLAVADVDGNGFAEVIASQARVPAGGNGVHVFTLLADRMVSSQVLVAPYGSINLFGLALVAADVDGDGRGDLVALGQDADEDLLFVFTGSTSGLRTVPTHVLLDPRPEVADARFGLVLGAGDFDSDGDGDIAALWGPGQGVPAGVLVYPGGPGGPDPQPYELDPTPGRENLGPMGVGDLDGDGYPDLVVGWAPATYAIHFGGPDGLQPTPGVQVSVPQGRTHEETSLAVGDFDGDGIDDLAIGAGWVPSAFEAHGLIDWIPGGPGLGQSEPLRVAVGFAPGEAIGFTLAAGDVDADGIDDLLDLGGTALRLRPGGPDGPAEDERQRVLMSPTVAEQLVVADLDGDGHDDVVRSVPEDPNTGFGRIEVRLGCVLDADGDNWPSDVDCDDALASVGPPSLWYPDADGDGYPVDGDPIEACEAPEGYAAPGIADCDDTDRTVYPQAGRCPPEARGCSSAPGGPGPLAWVVALWVLVPRRASAQESRPPREILRHAGGVNRRAQLLVPTRSHRQRNTWPLALSRERT